MFQRGYRIGLTPAQVLDMERWQFNACIQGYSDRCIDEAILTVMTGYWSAYYNNGKKPKKPSKIIEEMLKPEGSKKKKNDLDIAGYLAMEASFQQRIAQAKGERDE